MLYPRIWLSSHPLDLQVFQLVTSSPLLRKGIKQLIWDDTTFSDSLMDRKTYFATVRAETGTRGGWSVDPETSDEAIQEGYEFFLAASRDHHRIRTQRLDEKALQQALPLLQSLEKVVLTNQNLHPLPSVSGRGTSPSVRQWQALPFIDNMPFPPYVNWSMVNKPGENVIMDNDDIDQIVDVDFHDDQWCEELITFPEVVRVRRPFRGLLILMKALAQSDYGIRSFEVRPQYPGGFLRGANAGISHWWFRHWHAGLDDMCAVFRHLRTLKLVMGCETEENGAATVRQGHLRRVMAEAEMVEELELELHNSPVLDVLDAWMYPRLRQLALRDGIVDPQRLLAFLLAHRATLTFVDLEYCDSSGPAWTGLFYGMRTEVLCFKEIMFESLMQDSPRGTYCFWHGRGEKSASEALEDFVFRDRPLPLFLDNGMSGTPPPRFMQLP